MAKTELMKSLELGKKIVGHTALIALGDDDCLVRVRVMGLDADGRHGLRIRIAPVEGHGERSVEIGSLYDDEPSVAGRLNAELAAEKDLRDIRSRLISHQREKVGAYFAKLTPDQQKQIAEGCDLSLDTLLNPRGLMHSQLGQIADMATKLRHGLPITNDDED